MNIRKGMFSTGLLILIAGLVIGVSSFAPSQLIQFVVVVSAFFAGVMAIMTGKAIFSREVASRYIWVEGAVLILYAITAGVFGSDSSSFINLTTLFLLVFGVVEFTLTLQALNSSGVPNWNVFLQKLVTASAASIGAVYIFVAGTENENPAILFVGLVTIIIGGSFIRESKHIYPG